MSGDPQRTVIEVLAHDHREVEDLFRRLEEPGLAPEASRDLVERVTVELVRHAVAEEHWLYPAVREYVPDGSELADDETAEHGEMEVVLKALEGMSPLDPEYRARVDDLISDVRAHIAEEEQQLFPALAAATTPEHLCELGARVEQAKRNAPTHPHPAMPDTPPLNRVLDRGAGLIDRLRDALVRRR
ncbi:MAG: hemerythrin domain-containing protein [Actinocatenispora sp.]